MSLPPLLAGAAKRGERVALVTAGGEVSYASLLSRSARGAARLLAEAGAADLDGARVAFLLPADDTWVVALWSVWRAGGSAVPLPLSHPAAELAYAVDDAGASLLVAHPSTAERLGEIAASRRLGLLISYDLEGAPSRPLPEAGTGRGAILLYTSGTTSRPKGVLHTHATLAAQARTLVEAWGWSERDRTLNVLPLHHVHGIVNVVSCALLAGAVCEMHDGFDAAAVWDRLASGALTVFMAVPTVYSRLAAHWEAQPPQRRAELSNGAARLRLMVSGSAALPVALLSRWREITGHVLLERYGMTEIGMALSNPLDGERVPGAVGRPLPSVEIRVVDEAGADVADGTPGELLVRGPGVFREYWRRPEATAEAFVDGWFATGDVAVAESGVHRILGRKSVDILKTGGHKVSALQIEEVLREHPAVRDAAVVGLPDPEWGERVAAAVVADRVLTLDELRAFCRDRLAPYKLPTRLLLLPDLPRNALGKLTKPEVKRLLELAEAEPSSPRSG